MEFTKSTFSNGTTIDSPLLQLLLFNVMLTAVHLGSVAVSDPRRTRVAASLPNGCALLRDHPESTRKQRNV